MCICVRSCVRVCVRACVRDCVRACVDIYQSLWFAISDPFNAIFLVQKNVVFGYTKDTGYNLPMVPVTSLFVERSLRVDYCRP